MLYKDWQSDTSINKDWMTEQGFFMGVPLDSEDAPISEVMREAVYRYIKDSFGGSRLSLSDHERWAELFRARLTELNGSFWKQIQMDELVRVKDLVTADYSEFVQNYSQGVDTNKHLQTTKNDTVSNTDFEGKQNTSRVETTTTDRQGSKVKVTETPTTAGRTVQLNSNLAEATYIGESIPGGGGGGAGMPDIDPTHGSTAAGLWSISEGKETTTETTTPTGEIVQSQSPLEVNETGKDASTINSTGEMDTVSEGKRASIGGMLREGHRDFNGYNLTASIAAVREILPYNYLSAGLASLFRAGKEDGLWL